MKFKLLTTLLGTITLKAGFFGGKNTVSLDEDALQTIEDALAKNVSSEQEDLLIEVKGELDAQVRYNEEMEQALTQALADNGLTACSTSTESIALLARTCKEYGSKVTAHTLATHNGVEPTTDENLVDGFIDLEDEHNKLLFGTFV